MLNDSIMAFLNEAAAQSRTNVPDRDASLFLSGVLDSFSLVGALIASGNPKPDPQSRPKEGGRFSLKVEDLLLASDGQFAEELIVRAPGTANGARWIDSRQLEAGLHYGTMNGRSLILHAVRKLVESVAEIVERNGLGLDAVDLVIPHQANGNLLLALTKKLSLSRDRIVWNVDRFGNTGGASAFIALWQAYREERLSPGAVVLIVAFGAGFTWGAALCRAVTDSTS